MLSQPMTIISPAAQHFPPHARLPGSRVVGVWFDQVHGPNTKPTRTVDNLIWYRRAYRFTTPRGQRPLVEDCGRTKTIEQKICMVAL